MVEISLLTNDISDELYRVRDIFTRLSNTEQKQLTTTLNRLEQEKLIDDKLHKRIAALPSVTYPELRKLLVTGKPELLAQHIDYPDTVIMGKGIMSDDEIGKKAMDVATMEALLKSPRLIDIWKTLRQVVEQHSNKEKGRPPKNYIHCLIDELKKSGILTEEQYDTLNRDVYRKSFGELFQAMDHVHGSGIWSAIARKIIGATSKGVAGITTKQVVNKAGNAILDGASSAVRKRTETMLDEALNKKKKKKHNYLNDIPLGGI